ncbi:MAG TPA: TlpA disulfide reductase family protein [Dokdonella sp.]
MLERRHLLVVALAIAGATAGLFVGRMLRPDPRAALDTVPAGAPERLPAATSLPDLEGRAQPLAQWNGRLVLLNFWASWCAPCIEEMPLLDRFHQRHAARGLQVVGIASEAPGPTREFLAAHPVEYPILVDDPERGDLSRTLGNQHGVLPYSLLIGRDGRILARHAGNFTEESLERWVLPHL